MKTEKDYKAEIERLQGAIACRDATIRGQVVAMNQAADIIEQLQAENARLREAIKNELAFAADDEYIELREALEE